MEPETHKLPVRFYEIDLLRFLAALSVVFYHYTFRGYAADNYSPISYSALGRVTRYGYLGVQLFFIISGYVVLLSAQGKTIRQFFLSRITRLYPAFWIACSLTFVVKLIWGPSPAETQITQSLHAGVLQYLYNMTMLSGLLGVPAIDGAYWSLTAEIAFYFFIAVLVGFGLMKYCKWVLLAWLGYLCLPGLARSGTFFSSLLLPGHAPFFIAGMLFYLMQQAKGRTLLHFIMLGLAFVLAVRSSLVQATDMSTYYHAEISGTVVAGCITLFFIVFFIVSFRLVNLSRFPWLMWLGALTYPLYLVHSDIAFIAFHRVGYLANKYILLAGTIILMLTLAYLIHVLVEKRFGKALGQWVDGMITRFVRNESL